MRVQRYGDMTEDGKSVLRLTVQDDGDVVVAVEGPDPVTGKPAYAVVEFCETGQGGGRSPETHAALRALAEAMRRDAEGGR